MCEHLKTCAKEPISLTFFLDHHSHTLCVSAHLTPWKSRLHHSISTHWVSLTKNIFENVFLEMILQQFEVRTSPYFGVFTSIFGGFACMVKMEALIRVKYPSPFACKYSKMHLKFLHCESFINNQLHESNRFSSSFLGPQPP